MPRHFRTIFALAIATLTLSAATAVSVASSPQSDAHAQTGSAKPNSGHGGATPDDNSNVTHATPDASQNGAGDDVPGDNVSNGANGGNADPGGDGSEQGQAAAADVVPGSGRVKVLLPGSDHAIPVTAAQHLPAGTVIDAEQGSVTLDDEDGNPGSFTGGQFQVRKDADGRTELQLVGGDFSACSKGRAHAGGVQSAAKRFTRHKVVRQLWGRDHGGKFRTRGSSATATVRGTVWLTQDRCDGTRVAVKQGAVTVHDNAKHRDVTVTAGHSYTAQRKR